MNIINHNPYRIAGILSNATAREIERQRGRINAFAKVGKEIKSDYDFQILDSITRTEDSINKAFSDIQQAQDKVNYALFWFAEANPFDKTALEYLKKENPLKAIEIWEKVTINKEVTSKNFSSFNNLGTLKLISHFQEDIQNGIETKIKLIESDYFKSFINAVADETFAITSEKQIEKFIDELLRQFKNQYSSSEILQLFSNCNGSTQKYLSKKFTEEPLHNIESQIESTKKKRNQNKEDAYQFGLSLAAYSKDNLVTLQSLLGTTDLKYKTIADQLANEIMQCGIDYFNHSLENDSSDNYLEQAQKLTKIADRIAVGKLTKDRAKDSLASLADMKDREINQAIEVLSSIKLAYNKAISEIEAQVSQMLMSMSYNQSINYTKIDKLKENCLNWSKVVEVVRASISINDIAIIQLCQHQRKVSEYKNLVDFLFNKLGPIQINQVKHICYWKDVRAVQAKSTAKKVSSTISNATDSGCYIATMAYGDYNHPQVIELRNFRDDFLSKTIVGRHFIKFYYKYSPSLVEKLKNKQSINLIIRKGLDQFIKAIKK
ncbi:CFI-box-CTERM domain-containing protein [Polaribacter sp. 11A2H]|uniref:CFI-box-CTERM domain-containing protein n=1 Tax=Polaribacter sp. 11A2H TaxID=2687290 RepID=UPI001408D77B|nr:CFI-box-CTERM domain-containing protein [Polaribacter sp. 11A2H]